MNIILIQDTARIAEASTIALENHARLRGLYPWLPEIKIDEFIERIEGMTREGSVYALVDGTAMRAFLGWFTIDDFRNLGPGALTPDWCFGVTGDAGGASGWLERTAGSGLERGLERASDSRESSRAVSRLMSPLVRRLISDIKAAGLWIHAVGVPAISTAFLEEFSMLSYGRIVLDAARPAEELLVLPCAEPDGFIVRPARGDDAGELADLDERLARHVGSPPVLMPESHGFTFEEWQEWLAGSDSITIVAECSGKLVGFIKADPPHFDVSWFVHGDSTLAICGLYVDPAMRGRSVGDNLLRALVSAGAQRGYALVSVDCETHNPEARAFWTAHFRPVTWSFERRF